MKARLLVAAAGAALVAPLPAHASHADWRGTYCTTVAGTYDAGVWTVDLAVAVRAVEHADDTLLPATPAAYPISAWCELFVDGVSLGNALQAPERPGVTAAAGAYEFAGSVDATVFLCTHVTVDGETFVDCPVSLDELILPEPVHELIDAVGDALGPDRVDCPAFAALAPGVPGVLRITSEGDIYLDTERMWDCPA